MGRLHFPNIWPFHRHSWEEFYPTNYQAHVRMYKCACKKVYDQGVRGEHGQIIPYGFDADTGRPVFGAQCLQIGK